MVPNLSIVPKDISDVDLLGALRDGEIGQKLVAEKKIADLNYRKRLCAELEQLDRRAEKEQPSLLAECTKWQAECWRLFNIATMGVPVSDPSMTMSKLREIGRAKVKAYADWFIAQHERSIALQNHRHVSAPYTMSRDEIEQKLRASANPILKIFRNEMLDAHAATRRASNLITREFVKNGRRVIVSNGPSIARRLAAIREAIRQADDFALRPDQTNIDIELEKIRQNLPPIGATEESQQ